MKVLPESYVRLALLVIVLGVVGWVYWKGRHDQKQGGEVKTLRSEVKAVGKSNEISRKTQGRIDREGEAARRQDEQDRKVLDDATDSGAAGGPDDPGVRVAREAYERALCAARRLQREGACDASAAAP